MWSCPRSDRGDEWPLPGREPLTWAFALTGPPRRGSLSTTMTSPHTAPVHPAHAVVDAVGESADDAGGIGIVIIG